MIPVQFDKHVVPPVQKSQGKNPPQTDKINFFERLNPFIQLLLAIGNAIFLPSYFVYSHFLKKMTPSQKAFNEAMDLPVPDSEVENKPDTEPLEAEPESKEEAHVTSLEDQMAQLQERLHALEQGIRQDYLIVENMKEFEQLHVEISGILNQLKTNAASENEEADPSKEDLASLKQSALNLHDQLDGFCIREGEALLNQLQNVLNKLTKGGIDLPKEIREELLAVWDSLDHSLRPHLNHLKPELLKKKLTGKLNALKKRMEGIKAGLSQNQPAGLAEPLRLKNIGNSCYLDSVLQALACVDSICEDFNRPLSTEDKLTNPDEYGKKLAIQQELLPFLKAQSLNRGAGASKLGFILYLLEGPSLVRLREAIFKSGFESDFTKASLTHQHDAYAVIRILIDHFLPNNRFKAQEYAETANTNNDCFPGLVFPGPTEDRTILEVPLRSSENQALHRLIHCVMHKRRENKDQRLIDPQNGIVVEKKKEEGEKSKTLPAEKVNEWVAWCRFKELPKNLVLHFHRSIQKPNEPPKKDERPVDLPSDGIVDLSNYYDAPANGLKQGKYKIKSYVAHSGSSVYKGHYVTYVVIKGKYYFCDDTHPNSFKEITQKEFFGRKDAYLLVLERLPEDGLVENKAET